MSAGWWLAGVGAPVAFALAFAIGANDVANALGTAVGSGALSVRRATILGGVFEFLGTALLGWLVAGTLKTEIVDPAAFAEATGGRDDLFALGMFCALLSSAVWLLTATWLSLPVSTTQTIVGGVLGFGVYEMGSAALTTDKAAAVLLKIGLSWVLSPLLGCVVALALYAVSRVLVLGRRAPQDAARAFIPYVAAGTVMVLFGFVASSLFKIDVVSRNLPGWVVFVVVVIAGVGTATAVWFLARSSLGRARERLVTQRVRAAAAAAAGDAALVPEDGEHVPLHTDDGNNSSGSGSGGSGGNSGSSSPSSFKRASYSEPLGSAAAAAAVGQSGLVGLDDDDDDDGDDGDDDAAGDGGSERERRMERERQEALAARGLHLALAEDKYAPLMILTAVFVAFAHGANDVGNAVGPYSAVLEYAFTGNISKPGQEGTAGGDEGGIPWYVIVGAGVGLVIGLATLGHRVMATIGTKITKLTFSRGYSAQLGAALTVMLATYLGIPISTTTALIGAVTGAGLVTDAPPRVAGGAAAGSPASSSSPSLSPRRFFSLQHVNARMLVKIFAGWVVTVLIGFTLTCAFYSVGRDILANDGELTGPSVLAVIALALLAAVAATALGILRLAPESSTARAIHAFASS